jgi:hypothetical protein
MGGILHLKLNNGERPIANKYREGKMKRTLKRELKVCEIVKREAIDISAMPVDPWWMRTFVERLKANGVRVP